MSRITPEDVARTAALARLELDEAAPRAAARELEAILDYVAQLEAVDTDGVEPTAHVIPLQTPMRDDVASGVLAPEAAVMNAPQADGTAFGVPKVLDDEAEG